MTRGDRTPEAWTGPLTGTSFIAGILGAATLSKLPYPRPGSTADEIRAYFSQRPSPTTLSVCGQLIATVALARFASNVARTETAGQRPRATRAAARIGGTLATASLTASTACATTLTLPRDRPESRVVALHRWAFLLGGPIHGVGFGLVVAAAALDTGPRTRRSVARLSVAANLLSPLYLALEPAAWLIPIGRFSGYGLIATARR